MDKTTPEERAETARGEIMALRAIILAFLKFAPPQVRHEVNKALTIADGKAEKDKESADFRQGLDGVMQGAHRAMGDDRL